MDLDDIINTTLEEWPSGYGTCLESTRESNPSQVRVLSPPHFDKLSASPWMCMNWYTYILLCDQKIFYVGMTSDLERRVKQHKEKQSLFTKKFSEIDLVYSEKSETKELAEKREKQLKGWSFARKKP
jgi:putative endonuclease